MRSRVTFETDAINDYFSRSIDPGAFELCLVTDQHLIAVQNYVGPNLQNGHATLSVELPRNCRVGDELSFLAVVSDPTLGEWVRKHIPCVSKPGSDVEWSKDFSQ